MSAVDVQRAYAECIRLMQAAPRCNGVSSTPQPPTILLASLPGVERFRRVLVGYDVVVAENLSQAMRLLESEQVKLLIAGTRLTIHKCSSFFTVRERLGTTKVFESFASIGTWARFRSDSIVDSIRNAVKILTKDAVDPDAPC
jgi:hypothetical protein